jgi:hypothetical protein
MFSKLFCPSAPEARKPAAHGETAGLAAKINQAPAGAAGNSQQKISDFENIPNSPAVFS